MKKFVESPRVCSDCHLPIPLFPSDHHALWCCCGQTRYCKEEE